MDDQGPVQRDPDHVPAASGPDGRAFRNLPQLQTGRGADEPYISQGKNFQQKGARWETKGCERDSSDGGGGIFFRRKPFHDWRPSAQLVDIEPMPKYLQTMQQQGPPDGADWPMRYKPATQRVAAGCRAGARFAIQGVGGEKP